MPSGGGGGRRGEDTPDPNPNGLPAPPSIPNLGEGGGIEKNPEDSPISDTQNAPVNVGLPIAAGQVCKGIEIFSETCFYWSGTVTFQGFGDNRVTISPGSSSITFNTYTIGPGSVGFGNGSIGSNGEIQSWVPLTSYSGENNSFSSRFGAIYNSNIVRGVLEETVGFNNDYVNSNLTIGLSSQLRPRNMLIGIAVTGTVVLLFSPGPDELVGVYVTCKLAGACP